MANGTRKYRNAEKELLDAAQQVLPFQKPTDVCPSSDKLQRFVDGSIRDEQRRNKILAHIAQCQKCTKHLRDFRKELSGTRRLALALVAALIVIVILWLWPERDRWIRHPAQSALLDLRNSVLERGVENEAIPVSRDVTDLAITLPIGSPTGLYQISVFGSSNEPALLNASAPATINFDRTELHVRLDLKRLAPGTYLLGIRREDSAWSYYPVKLTGP